MTRCPEECKKQWKPKQGKLGWEKQREEERKKKRAEETEKRKDNKDKSSSRRIENLG